MVRYRIFFDFTKEEAWLTDMARQGWQLVRVNFGYHFRKAEPQDAPIRIDFRAFSHQVEFLNYVTLFEDSGWQHLAGNKNSGTQIFQRAAGATEADAEDIFSDALSRAERYRRFSRMWLALALLTLVVLALLAAVRTADLRALVDPTRFFLTPGLWQRTGTAFWSAFWFEAPFAIFRALLLYFFPLALIFYLISAVQSNRLYRKGKKDDDATDPE